jgi:autophagy-related protein 9
MWRWANVEDLDNFLKDVYTYFLGNGIWSILLTRVLNLLYVHAYAPLNGPQN